MSVPTSAMIAVAAVLAIPGIVSRRLISSAKGVDNSSIDSSIVFK
jgi:hypothetical protein